MAHSWRFYTKASRTAAGRAVDDMYEKLAAVVGEDLAEHLEPGEELEPAKLGCWPDVAVLASPVPTADEVETAVAEAGNTGVRVQDAALKRLAKCVSSIRIDHPRDFDPALVTAVRALVAALGPCVFSKGAGFDLLTSETLLADIAKATDLAAAMRAAVAGKLVDKDDDEDDEDDDEEEDEDDEEEEEDDDEPPSDSARPEVLRGTLAAMAELPRARRKASELMGSAPDLVARFTERLARVGAEPDAAVAKALNVTEKDVIGARKALALILRRAENR